MPWVCERCGHQLNGNDPPCPQCGFDGLEQVREERVPVRLSPTALFVWRCPDCGHTHGRRHARCTVCDRMGIVATYSEDGVDAPDRPINDSTDRSATCARALDATMASAAWLVAFGLGLLGVVAGLLFLIGGSPTFGTPLLFVGLFTLPSVRERLGQIIGTKPPGWLAAIVYVVGLVAAVVWYNV